MELFIIRDGQQTGPFTEETVQGLLKKGGLRPDDMGWHKGLPAWLPLAEVFQPGSQGRAEPPPVSGVRSGVRSRNATARQRAVLQYLGLPVSEQTSREEAALAISDAMENPKLTSRLAKWGEEKLRLHPDLFQEELDYRRANRISRYLELCQTDGAEVVKDITKAHVQVLMESLDKRQTGWDQDARSALWDYLLPSVAEHFPQLVQEEWKGKLRYGGTSKVAAAYASTPGTGVLTPPPASPGPIRAAVRGIVYGMIALGLVIGGMYLFRETGKSDIARNDAEPAAVAPAADDKPGETAATPAQGEAAPEGAEHPTKAPLIGAEPKEAIAAAKPAEPAAPANDAPAAEAAPAPEPPASALAQAINNATTFTPAPPPPGAAPAMSQPLEVPAAPAAAEPVVRDSATLTKTVTVQLRFGKVTLNPGTRLRLIALEGANARVNFNNNVVVVPVASTDIDPAVTVVAAPPVVPAPLAPAAAPMPAVAPTASAPAPSTFTPKPLPSSDF